MARHESALIAAATDLDAELTRFEEATQGFVKTPPSSQQLGTSAGALNEKLKGPTGMVDVQIEMTNLATRAEALTTIAKSQDFEDLARQADGLRQQILAARNKLAKAETGQLS